MSHPIPTPYTDKIRPGPDNDPETFCQACGERPAQLELSDEDYDRAIAHTEFAGQTLRRAKKAAHDGDSATAGSLTSVAMHHFLHGHQALKGAHYTREGNYLAANEASKEVAKMLIRAKCSFDEEKGMSGRQGLQWAMQGLGAMRSALARAS